jgi:pyruvate ferredoxin oxidoreductase gamma subunit
MVLDETLLEVFEDFGKLSKESFLIINTQKSKEEILKQINFKGKLVTIDASGLSKEIVGENRPNTVILGKFSAVMKIVRLENLVKVFRQKYQEKLGEEKTNKNINAVREAYEN